MVKKILCLLVIMMTFPSYTLAFGGASLNIANDIIAEDSRPRENKCKATNRLKTVQTCECVEDTEGKEICFKVPYTFVERVLVCEGENK